MAIEWNVLTHQEELVVETLALAYNQALSLPLRHAHDNDLNEFVLHIHAAQNIILARVGSRALGRSRSNG